MIGRLNHVAIAVKNLAAATAVYKNALGAVVTDPLPQPDQECEIVRDLGGWRSGVGCGGMVVAICQCDIGGGGTAREFFEQRRGIDHAHLMRARVGDAD